MTIKLADQDQTTETVEYDKLTASGSLVYVESNGTVTAYPLVNILFFSFPAD